MIKKKIKSEKGVTLVSLAIAVTVLVILSNIIIYNVRENLKIGKLTEMQNDIENLRDKIFLYYAQNGKIPAKVVYPNINHLKVAGVISEAVDTGDFLVIDLSAIEILTLKRGFNYENIKTKTSLTEEEAKNNTDIYIINEASHNIFYVAGIEIDNEVYYTDTDEVDTVPVDLRYVEGVRIPEGFHYAGGTKALGNIFIKNEDETEEYKWIAVENGIATISANDVNIKESETEDFIKSVNYYQGYYKNTANNTVKYFTLEKWSPTYDKEDIYQDKNGEIAYIPKDFQVSEVPGENTIAEGLVVKDNKQNEWVWIQVPKSIYTNPAYNGGTAPTSAEDYAKIESIMQAYASDYRETDNTDTFYSTEQHGFADATEYNNWKNSMLKSVYEKGGFYVGRYEVGTDIARTAVGDALTTPVIQRDKYAYNWITCSQAQTLAKQLVEADKTSSLMFGIQWDLMLKFIEAKGARTSSELKTNSGTWGNYADSSFTIIRGKYLTSSANSYTQVNGNYQKTNSISALLTTGATDRNSVLNIYDVVGNVWEWTLEKNPDDKVPCNSRGYSYRDNVSEKGAIFREGNEPSVSNNYAGFRPVLW